MYKTIFVISLLVFTVLAKDRLAPGECLGQGGTLTSANGCFRLIMQTDGNLVIYRTSNGKALWSNSQARTCTNRACMQKDGNFVTYDCHNKATWSSGTIGNEGSSLKMQNDGNLVIYAWNSNRAVWASKTVSPC